MNPMDNISLCINCPRCIDDDEALYCTAVICILEGDTIEPET